MYEDPNNVKLTILKLNSGFFLTIVIIDQRAFERYELDFGRLA